MLRMYDGWGRATPITAVRLEENIVVRKMITPLLRNTSTTFNGISSLISGNASTSVTTTTTAKKNNSTKSSPFKKSSSSHMDASSSVRAAVVVGYGLVKQKHMGRSLMGLFAKQGVDPRRYLKEFTVTPDAILEPGTKLGVKHFVPGQIVDVSGTTIGKGFQGAMKRWGFSGQPRTHGASLSHRSLGGTGARQDPGKTWKGKKMHGHMGNVRRTQQSVVVFGMDPSRDLLFLKGSTPGHAGGILEIRDSIKSPKQFEKLSLDPPFPTAPPVDVVNTLNDISIKNWLLVKKEDKDPLKVVVT
jgi:50S ribosomal protein uL3